MSSVRVHRGLQRLNRFRRRRIDVCCCGLSKSGTQSIAGLFSAYRSAHHPDTEVRLQLAIDYLEGRVDDPTATEILRRRDIRLGLELESSALAGILIRPLSNACPKKRFILTIRDVYSWCDSWIDHSINRPVGPASPWSKLDVVRLRVQAFEPSRFDGPLKDRGLPSLACFFSLWAHHNGQVLASVPADRLFVVRTDEITARAAEIARWAGVPAGTLRPEQAWLNRATSKHRVLDQLDSSYVAEIADQWCGELMGAYFPDVSGPS